MSTALWRTLDELLLSLAVQGRLRLEDLLLDGRQRSGPLALGVLVGLQQQTQVRQHALVGFENHPQLVLASAVHPRLIRGVRVLRGDEVDREFLLRAVDLVIEFEAEREVLTVLGVAEFVGLMTSPERILKFGR